MPDEYDMQDPSCPPHDRRQNKDREDIIAHRAAKEAVREVFAQLGVDVTDPRQVESFREDLRLASKIRKAADKGFFFMLAAGFSLLVAGGYVAIASKFGSG